MVKDTLGIDCHTWTVELGDEPVVRYGVGQPSSPRVKRMYLTDWQQREIREEAGEVCDYVELDTGVHVLYGAPPEGFGAAV